MKIVITGSQGFLGSTLCKHLQENRQPYLGVDCKPGDDHNALRLDITNPAQLNQLPLEPNDIVVNLAARQWADTPPRKNRQAFFDAVNVKGLENLLNVMQQKSCHNLINFSSDMVYGLPQQVPLDESHRQNPIGEYGSSKKKAEQLCEDYRKQGFNITIFRPRLILGPGRLGVLAKLFHLIENNRPVPLIGKGNNYYQMVSVFDCVSAIEKAITAKLPNQAFNLGSKELISTFNLLGELIKSKHSKSKLIRTPAILCFAALKCLKPLGIEPLYKEQYLLANKMYYVATNKAQQALGWQPNYSDKRMLSEAYQWYLENKKSK